MDFEVQLEKFQGPLDLLLELIEQEKLDISEVSLAKVTDAYLQRLNAAERIPPEELADFLVVATRLLLIKSRLLLPFLNVGVEEEGPNLETQLKILKEYLDASKIIGRILGKRRFLFVHEKLPAFDIGFAPPPGLTGDRMAEMFRGVIRRLDLIVRVPKATVEKTVSIHEKIKEIQATISMASEVSFRHLVMSAKTRTEIVVSFLALLELIKQRQIHVSQGGMFDDITIRKVEAQPA